MPETITTAVGNDVLDELEASFLSCEGAPAVEALLALLPPAELRPAGARDDPALRPTVRTSNSRCC